MDKVWRHCVLDAALSHDGIFCFCPCEMNGNEISDVITGMNYLSDVPPDGMKLVAVVHHDGQVAVEKWMDNNKEQLDTLKSKLADNQKTSRV